jgi:hypothetical protein
MQIAAIKPSARLGRFHGNLPSKIDNNFRTKAPLSVIKTSDKRMLRVEQGGNEAESSGREKVFHLLNG